MCLVLTKSFAKLVQGTKRKKNYPRALNEEDQIDVLGTFAAKPTSCLRSLAEQTGCNTVTLYENH